MSHRTDRTGPLLEFLRSTDGETYHVSELARRTFPDEWRSLDDAGRKSLRSLTATTLSRLVRDVPEVVRVTRGSYRYERRDRSTTVAEPQRLAVDETKTTSPVAVPTVTPICQFDDGDLALIVDGETGLWARVR